MKIHWVRKLHEAAQCFKKKKFFFFVMLANNCTTVHVLLI